MTAPALHDWSDPLEYGVKLDRNYDDLPCTPTYTVRTPDWIQEAMNDDELKQILDDAVLCGFDRSQVQITECPF
jgi:hypothetical protein